MITKYDVVIIGAGVLGLSLAYHLSKNKDLSVLVLERENEIAPHASGKNAGMLRHLYKSKQLTDWARRSRNSLPSLIEDTAITPITSCIAGRTPPAHNSDLFESGEFLDSSGKMVPAVITKNDALINSKVYNQGLLKLCLERSVDIRLNSKVKQVQRVGQVWNTSLSSGHGFSSKVVVSASGAWMSEALPKGIDSLPFQSFVRHLFLVNCQSPVLSEFGYFWEETSGYYARRWGKDQMLFSFCDKVPAQPEHYSLPPRTLELALERVKPLIGEEAGERPIGRFWHCFRTYLPDNFPVVGQEPMAENFYYLAGFGGFGMSTSFAAAQDLADVIIGNEIKLPKEVLVERFLDTKRNKVSNF